MAEKGSKATTKGNQAAETFACELAHIEVTVRKMFGGNGLFHEGTMFALVDSQGQCFLRGDESTAEKFAKLGSERHGRMPYWQIPSTVRSDATELRSWVESAVTISRRTK